jgi:DNA-binding transcriptional regulator YhcF (GntR family)
MAWRLDSERPIYSQIMERVIMQIVSGAYRPGERLPSVRELAMEAAVNPNTMQKALAELERTGLVKSQRTSGRFITEDTALITAEKIKIARKEIMDFRNKMQAIGLTTEEIVQMLHENGETGVAQPAPQHLGNAVPGTERFAPQNPGNAVPGTDRFVPQNFGDTASGEDADGQQGNRKNDSGEGLNL